MPACRPLRVVVVLLLACGVASAQPTGTPITISGRVIDTFGRPVRGATVSIEALPSAAPSITDRRGHYQIEGAPIAAAIVVIAEGFETGLGTVVGPTVDDIVLLSEKQATETIEISGEAPADAPGAAKLDRTELERIPGTGNDVIRALNAMPGVASFPLPLGYSGVVIRGSSPQDSKILIDDFEVPVLYHDIGFRSIVPAEAIDKLDYIPGGFDVQYGRAASGIVALTTRPGSDNRSEQFEISVIDGGLIAQGKTDPKTNYMIAFRRSVIDLLLPAILPSNLDLALTTVPRYYDEQLRVDHVLSPNWKLRVSSVGSDDVLELFTDKAQSADQRFYTRTRFVRLTTAASWHDGPWFGTLAASGLATQFVFDRGIYQFIDARQESLTLRGELTRTSKQYAGLADVTWRVGGEAVAAHNAIGLALPIEPREGEPRPNGMNANDTTQKFHGVIWTPDFAAWTAVAANLDPRIKVTAGLRVDEFTRIHDYAVQPRGDLQIKLSNAVTARLAAGAYRRPPEFQGELLFSTLHPERSTQVIAGLQLEPREGLRIQSSLYYTDRTDLIVHAPDGIDLINQGRGTTYGAELLTTFRDGPWFAWLSYSYSHSTRVDTPGGPERLFDYDQPHSLNVAVSHRWRKWQLGGRFQLYSGLPYTPATGSVFDSDANTYIPIYGPINSERAPIHHQVDLRLDRSWKWGAANLTYFLDIQNVYLNQSTVAYFYSYDYTQRSAFKSLPIIPSTGLRGVF